jgi:hypothetical protein
MMVVLREQQQATTVNDDDKEGEPRLGICHNQHEFQLRFFTAKYNY